LASSCPYLYTDYHWHYNPPNHQRGGQIIQQDSNFAVGKIQLVTLQNYLKRQANNNQVNNYITKKRENITCHKLDIELLKETKKETKN
jgi:hypothetical protein